MDYNEAAQVWEYDPETGFLFWKIAPYRHKRGSRAGTKGGRYCQVYHDGKNYTVHRLAWLLSTTRWPERQIDHINGNRNDNRLVNLREVSSRGNCINREIHRTGHLPGAVYDKKRGRYKAMIFIKGKPVTLGRFHTEKESHETYMQAFIKAEEQGNG